MGETTPRSALDKAYREMVSRWLGALAMRHSLTSQMKIAKALGLDRATVSRYLSGDTRAPLQRLQYAKRTLGEEVPPEIVEAFWASEAVNDRHPPNTVEDDIRRQVEDQLEKLPEDQRERLLEELIRSVRPR